MSLNYHIYRRPKRNCALNHFLTFNKNAINEFQYFILQELIEDGLLCKCVYFTSWSMPLEEWGIQLFLSDICPSFSKPC